MVREYRAKCTRSTDLSGSQVWQPVYESGLRGTICGRYEHQYNVIGGRIVDLGLMHRCRELTTYLHRPTFVVPEAGLTEWLPAASNAGYPIHGEISSIKSMQ
jgi:hypothetical protein